MMYINYIHKSTIDRDSTFAFFLIYNVYKLGAAVSHSQPWMVSQLASQLATYIKQQFDCPREKEREEDVVSNE